ncbi:CC domain-containing protein [Caenorhabditis elegans]|uniref:CC domain-containing protein n=1 Tax=Caenorhabditis elegans TaxID=6239 RepID=Q20251_CAEEL|nr:CC domain-containing protein [Caenorhabditis elegans]CAB01188.2 CC domain-containing protein [Caenorhabditis elegans]|eukprot:NP_506536.2 Uncharacterized protein CELE_F40G12.9 [Caenorhabditis elegans]
MKKLLTGRFELENLKVRKFDVKKSKLPICLFTEAANIACKSETTKAVDGVCADGMTIINGDNCCSSEDVSDVDARACRSEPMPAIGGLCPYGFILVADDGCCPNSDAYAKQK